MKAPTSPSLPAPLREARETNGITSRLMLTYAERVGGRDAVDEVLRRCGLEGRETEMRDEDTWFSVDTKIRLFEALAEVLDDPLATRKAGARALDLNVGEGLKVALRALGSPRLVYQQIVRANSKFSARHEMQLVELETTRARLRFLDRTGADIHRLDCQYTLGLLGCIPELFGRPPARVTHPVCGVGTGGDCLYDVSWDRVELSVRSRVAAGAAAAAALAGSAVAAPALLPAAAAVSACLGAAVAWRASHVRRRQIRRLEAEVVEQAAAADRLRTSLEDLVSELRLEELLDKIVHNATGAVSGKQFALLVLEDGRLRCRSSTGLPDESVQMLEVWGVGAMGLSEPELIEDVAVVPALAELGRHPEVPMRSLCAAPLAYRGETVGILVALANQPRTFLPRDTHLVRSYAAQAAIALANARLFAAQHALATRDALTGLLNHREFHEAIERELARADRNGSQVSVALLDLDGFKLVNDASGHAAGDRVLRETAGALVASCRQSDLAFRLGGDEFALLLPETAPEDAEVVAARAAAAIEELDAPTSASYGVAAWPADGDDKDALLEQADSRLYAMKGTRRFPDDVAVLEQMAGQLAARLAELRGR